MAMLDAHWNSLRAIAIGDGARYWGADRLSRRAILDQRTLRGAAGLPVEFAHDV